MPASTLPVADSVLFGHQDRYYVDQHNRPKLRDAGLAAFQRLFLDFVPAVVEACMALVDQDRDGEYVEHALVKRVVEMFETLGQHSLGFYKSAFEVRLNTLRWRPRAWVRLTS